ncbi:MAG: (d)CMP kinase [Bacteroidia bacterium]
MKAIVIAIDGYSSCGKSTIAKELSKILAYKYVDTGAMYRAVTLYFIQNHIDFNNIQDVINALEKISITFKIDEQTQIQETFLNGENIENEIRVNPRVAGFVSNVSSISKVRRFLVKQQQELGKLRGIIMDGRDIGTVVFPDAELKLFITADPNVRAQRRFDELKAKGNTTTFEEVLANLTKRDYIDSNRDDSPLMKADDAIEIDNSNINQKEQLELILKLVNEKIGLKA